MTKIPANVLMFAQDKVDVYKRFRDYFNHYMTEVEGKKLSFDASISFEEKNERMHKDLLDEIQRVSGVNFAEMKAEVAMTHPTFRWATFAVVNAMIDTVLPEVLIDSVGLYTDVRTGGYGDSFVFDVEPRDLFTVTVAGKGKRHSEVKKQFNGQVSIIPVEHDVTVAVSLYRVLAGQENLAKFVMKAIRSLETQMTYDAYDAFSTALGALATSGDTQLKVSGYSESTAIGLAQKVSSWNGGKKAVFAGTQLAVSNILPANSNYRYDIESNYVKVGYVQTFKNFDVMVLPQVADYATPFKTKLKDTEIYVLSPGADKILKMCIEGATYTVADGIHDNANLTQNVTLKKNFGVGVATSSIAGIITLG